MHVFNLYTVNEKIHNFPTCIFVKYGFKNDQSFLSPTDSLKLRTAKAIIQNNGKPKFVAPT